VDKVIHCDCGFDARAEYEDGLLAEVQRHAWEAHGMALSHDEALVLTSRAELDATPSRNPVSGLTSEAKEEE
jgi:predicted small metal-binding protein